MDTFLQSGHGKLCLHFSLKFILHFLKIYIKKFVLVQLCTEIPGKVHGPHDNSVPVPFSSIISSVPLSMIGLPRSSAVKTSVLSCAEG